MSVHQPNRAPAKSQALIFFQVLAHQRAVAVAVHRKGLRDRFQLLQYREIGNIPGVQNNIDAVEKFEDARRQAGQHIGNMSVSKDADFHFC